MYRFTLQSESLHDPEFGLNQKVVITFEADTLDQTLGRFRELLLATGFELGGLVVEPETSTDES